MSNVILHVVNADGFVVKSEIQPAWISKLNNLDDHKRRLQRQVVEQEEMYLNDDSVARDAAAEFSGNV